VPAILVKRGIVLFDVLEFPKYLYYKMEPATGN